MQGLLTIFYASGERLRANLRKRSVKLPETITQTLVKPATVPHNALVLKFSHDYDKLPMQWEGQKAQLLFVRPILLQNQLPALLDYDTSIRGDGKYKLPKTGGYILLVFELLETGAIFTTIRRFTYEKYEFYRKNLDRSFTLVRAMD